MPCDCFNQDVPCCVLVVRSNFSCVTTLHAVFIVELFSGLTLLCVAATP